MKKRISAFIAAVTVFVLSFSFFAFAARSEARQALRLVDKAKLIEKADEEAFLEKLDTISEELQFDFVVATVKTTGGKDIQTFTDDYFTENFPEYYGDEDYDYDYDLDEYEEEWEW